MKRPASARVAVPASKGEINTQRIGVPGAGGPLPAPGKPPKGPKVKSPKGRMPKAPPMGASLLSGPGGPLGLRNVRSA